MSSISNKKIYIREIQTPVSPLIIGAIDNGICLVEFVGRVKLDRQLQDLEKRACARCVYKNHALLIQLERELNDYFQGRIKKFSVPLVTFGTDFQRRVWDALLRIKHGQTCSYVELAKSLQHPKAVRAVANANARNKISILIPCHRVIGEDGALTGYAAGLPIKKYLLDLEKNIHVNYDCV